MYIKNRWTQLEGRTPHHPIYFDGSFIAKRVPFARADCCNLLNFQFTKEHQRPDKTPWDEQPDFKWVVLKPGPASKDLFGNVYLNAETINKL